MDVRNCRTCNTENLAQSAHTLLSITKNVLENTKYYYAIPLVFGLLEALLLLKLNTTFDPSGSRKGTIPKGAVSSTAAET